MTQDGKAFVTGRGHAIRILPMPEELDLATADSLAARGCAAIAHRTWLLLLDLTGLSFCDARGLSAFIQIANRADKAGCCYGLIAPRPPVAKILRITRLDQRMPVFATIDDALAHFTAIASPCAVKDANQQLGAVPTISPAWISLGERVNHQEAHILTYKGPHDRRAGVHALSFPGHARDPWQRTDAVPLQRDKDAHGSSRSSGQLRPDLEEGLLATMISTISLMEATARIQRETAEILRNLAARNGNDAAIQRLKDAEATIQELASSHQGTRGRLDQLEKLQRRLWGRQANSQAGALTAREQTVLRLLRGTLSLREIGQELYVSQNTIKSHTKAIYRKLGISNRHDAIQRGRDLGIFLLKEC